MIVRKLVSGVAAGSALVAAATVVLVSACIAVIALLEHYVGSAGAAAIITGVLAVVLAAGGLFISGRSKPAKGKVVADIPVAEQSLPQKLFYMLRDRPVIAAGAAVGAGLLTWRNPRLMGTIMSLFAMGRERA